MFHPLRPFAGAIFDLDGTLLDSMSVWAEIDQEFLGRRGIAVPPDYMEAITPLGFRGTADYTIARFGLTDTPEELMAEWSAMALEKYSFHVGMKPGAKALLDEFRAAGIPMGVASALSKHLAEPCLRRNGIDGCFSAIVMTDEVGIGKNQPGIWKIVAGQIGVPAKNCIAFDDAAASLIGAKAAGLQTVGVFDPHSGGKNGLQEASDLYVETLEKLAGLSMIRIPQEKF